MKFIQVKPILSNGSSFQGNIDESYHTLKKVFGEPNSNGDGHKVDVEWILQFEDGSYATIYNYKNGRNYLGSEGLPKSKIEDWHVGGFSEKALKNVKMALKDFGGAYLA
jgi:hypothetical protein